jgi:hypothetical protein
MCTQAGAARTQPNWKIGIGRAPVLSWVQTHARLGACSLAGSSCETADDFSEQIRYSSNTAGSQRGAGR